MATDGGHDDDGRSKNDKLLNSGLKLVHSNLAKKRASKRPPSDATLQADSQDEADPTTVVRTKQHFENHDTGNAERLASLHGEHIRYVDKWERYIVWDKTHWRVDPGQARVLALTKDVTKDIGRSVPEAIPEERKGIRAWYQKSNSSERRWAMLRLLKAEEGILVDNEALDKDPYLLNVENGTLDLRTGELLKHEPKRLLMKTLPVRYDPKAAAPRWEQFLKEVLPDEETRAFVLRFLGYCLTGDISERMFMVFVGGGLNGKTALVNAVENVLGEYAVTAPSSILVAKEHEPHPNDIATLHRRRLAVMSEVRKGATFDEEKLKRVTGGDRLTARFVHQDYWLFTPTHKLLVLVNHKPGVKDSTDSFWDRVAIVPFNRRIAKDKIDKHLGAKLLLEKEGILACLVRACLEWQEKGLMRPKAVLEATGNYRDDEDTAGRFLKECTVPDKEAFTLTRSLLAANKAWADQQNLRRPINAKDLAEKLRADPYLCKAAKDREGNAGWKGVRLTVGRKAGV